MAGQKAQIERMCVSLSSTPLFFFFFLPRKLSLVFAIRFNARCNPTLAKRHRIAFDDARKKKRGVDDKETHIRSIYAFSLVDGLMV